MSHFVECQTEFRDPQALVAALVECGFEEPQIEIHEQAVPLYGYQGDMRPQMAHIVIRRQHVGPAANDVGWERQPDGAYRAWISEYDGHHRFDQAMQDRIKQEYAYRLRDDVENGAPQVVCQSFEHARHTREGPTPCLRGVGHPPPNTE